MSPCCLLALLALIPLTLAANPGVKVKLTDKGIEYGKQIGMASLQQKLKTIKVPDISGTEKVPHVGKVKYSLTGMTIVNLGLPKSALVLVPGTGVSLAITNAFINLHGNWRVRYFRFIQDRGSFDLAVNGLTITANIAIKSDETGRPMVSTVNCVANVGRASIKFHGGASWLYNLFKSYIDKALRSALQKQICPLVADAITDMNQHLKTFNVLAKVDQYAEIEYSMVTSPTISKSSMEFSLKGEFYNIVKHQEPPFSPTPFSLPPQDNNMLYIGVSSFTPNSAGFVYNNAGALSLYVTDDMIPPSSPIRLNTGTFGVFIPEIAKRFPGMMMKLLVKTVKEPTISLEPNNVTVQASGTVTAYAIQPNTTLSPLFVLNMEGSVSAQLNVTGVKLAGAITLNKIEMTLGTSYVGQFQVQSLDNIFLMVLKVVVIPKVNAHLEKGFPLPSIGKMNLVNTQLQVLKDYMLIGTDVQFTG
ncbi:bactericidal permeability-increasing protein [Salmo salar]|uniref:Bactericidal permeability-increasing protein n=1 Tax=Salmo salar TaxID=8030 RepID=A0A1S3LCC7_SALSA|nr:bactericidal permeability-increasing protein-like [Salmo salar]|eukprot:XP_013988612.1 PREDICTED: bactericidal permeability-increasing protein-like [Salmo salar]